MITAAILAASTFNTTSTSRLNFVAACVQNFNPEILHFYWIVRQNEVDSFQWLVHMLTEIQYELKRSRKTHQIERCYYCEINIYITAAAKTPKIPDPLHRTARKLGAGSSIPPSFTAEQVGAASKGRRARKANGRRLRRRRAGGGRG